MAKNIGVPGNAIAESIEFAQQLIDEAKAVRRVQKWIEESARHDLYIEALKFLIKDDEGANVLLVINAVNENKAIVAFVGGTSVLDCINSLGKLTKTGRVRWKADEYRQQHP